MTDIDELKTTVRFNLLQSSGCDGISVTFHVSQRQSVELHRRYDSSVHPDGSVSFPAHHILACPAGCCVVPQAADSKLPIPIDGEEHLVETFFDCEEDWLAAWDSLSLGTNCFEGKEAFNIRLLVEARIAQGGLKKVGQRGKSVKGVDDRERDLRENFMSTVFAKKCSGQSLKTAVREALEMPLELLPIRYRLRMAELQNDCDPKSRSCGMRELVNDAAKDARDEEKAAMKAIGA